LAAMPVFTAILGKVFLNDAVEKAFSVVMVLVLLGLGLIAFHSNSSSLNSAFGNAMAFITMLGFSISVTLARKEKARSMLPALSIGLLLSGVVLVMFIDPFQYFLHKPALYLLHGVTLAIAVSALAQAARYTKGSVVTLFMLLEAALAPIVAWAIFSEYPGVAVIAGGLLVMMAVAMYGVWLVSRSR
jgi:drug/metabolite transporter (DMT)-like permease